MTKAETIVEHVVVTFFEAAIAYLTINQTNLTGSAKLTAIGALGAGISAAYNLARQANPTLPNLEPTVSTPEVPTVITPTEPVAPPVMIPVTDVPVVTDEPTLDQPQN